MTVTTNKGYTLPAVGADFGIWGTELNADLGIIDTNLGGVTVVSVTGNANVTATAGQAQNLIHELTGTLTGNIRYILPAHSGMYIIYNLTSGAFTVTVVTVNSGTGIVAPQGSPISIWSDGTNMLPMMANTTSSLTVSGVLTVNGTAVISSSVSAASAAISGNETVGGTLGVTGVSTMTGALHANGGFTTTSSVLSGNESVAGSVTAGSLSVTGAATVGSTLNVTGAATFNSTITTPSSILASGSITANSSMVTNAIFPGGPSDLGYELWGGAGGSVITWNNSAPQGWRTIWDVNTGSLGYYHANGTNLWLVDTGGNTFQTGNVSAANVSDIRTKKNVVDYTRSLSDIVQLRPVSYQYNGVGGTIEDDVVHIGLIAQEAQPFIPECVEPTRQFPADPMTGALPEVSRLPDQLSLHPDSLKYAFINAFRELSERLAKAEARIAELQA